VNLLHRWLCGSSAWGRVVTGAILPWVLEGLEPGGEMLEIGPGYGAATNVLRARATRLTCVEIDPRLAARLARRVTDPAVTVLREDATALSAADATFDSAICLSMLHHVPSPALQDRLLAETARVLRPGGLLAGFDGSPTLFFRLLHVGDTAVVVPPSTLPDRLARAGFGDISIDARRSGFRFRARRNGPLPA
jgi:SAM-dependent methyltransferase